MGLTCVSQGLPASVFGLVFCLAQKRKKKRKEKLITHSIFGADDFLGLPRRGVPGEQGSSASHEPSPAVPCPYFDDLCASRLDPATSSFSFFPSLSFNLSDPWPRPCRPSYSWCSARSRYSADVASLRAWMEKLPAAGETGAKVLSWVNGRDTRGRRGSTPKPP